MMKIKFIYTSIALMTLGITFPAYAKVDKECVRNGAHLGVDICTDDQKGDNDFNAFVKCMTNGLPDLGWWCAADDTTAKPSSTLSKALEQKGLKKSGE